VANRVEPQAAKEKKQSTVKGMLIGGAIGLLIAIIAWFAGGWSQGAAYRDQVAAATQEAAAARTESARLQEVVEAQRARIALYEATTNLERRNYGSASEDLRRVDRLLQGVDPAVAGVDAPALAALRKDVTDIDLTVQSDVGAQRSRILDIAERLGALLPAPAPDATPAVE